ncbi:MAG: hypothetical protein AB3N06_01410 [Erythrobacter sp.]
MSEPTIPESVLASPTGATDARVADGLAAIPESASDQSSAILLFALLGLGGIGLAALLLMRSRRRRREAEVPIIERPIVRTSHPLDRDPQVTTFDAPPAAPRDEPARPLGSGYTPSVEIPATLPHDPEERGRLLQRMIRARPDRANPFASHKARAKRARLILQSIGTRFNVRKPGIDLSQYTNVWPELRGWRPATS